MKSTQRHGTRAVMAGTALLALSAATIVWSGPAAQAVPTGSYSVSVGPVLNNPFTSDSPASSYIDKDGTYHAEFAAALYGPTENRKWSWYTGNDYGSLTADTTLNSAVDPSNPANSNANTTVRCNSSPTGIQASANPNSPTDQLNYCDLIGVWVDPDTGAWNGLVHNEFTMDPFTPTGYHYDSIDYATSTDQGHTWTIASHAITSPFSTTRQDDTGFPQSTWYFGDGDQRLYADYASGYFYVFYTSRVIDKPGQSGLNVTSLAHVARAPMSGKLAGGTWSKWYNGSWTQPGVGGLESNMVPVDSTNSAGYTPVANDYSPANPGSIAQQLAAGTLPSKSALLTMNITYDAYLGLYVGEPEVVDQDAGGPQTFYVTDNLATQKWYAIGDTGSFTTGSWYRWILDTANLTNPTITGKTMRAFFDGKYSDITIDATNPATSPVASGITYQVSTSAGRFLSQVSGTSSTTSAAGDSTSTLQQWTFISNGDGSFTILNASTGGALSVPQQSSGRAWGTTPIVTGISSGPTVSQQWFLVSDTDPATGDKLSSYRLINRYSGLDLALSSTSGRLAETTPLRSWTDSTGSPVGAGRSAAEQTLSLTAVGTTTLTLKQDLARNQPTTASSVESGTSFSANLATDGNPSSRWSSAASDSQWIQVDLGSVKAVNEVTLDWESAYAKGYQVQVSTNGSAWTTIYSTTTGDGGTDNLTGLHGSGRYVRIFGTQRATGYGLSLYDFEVYRDNATLGRPTTASSVESGTSFTANLATDGDPGTRWSSAGSDPQWIQVDLGSTTTIDEVVLSWESAYAKAYQLQVSADGSTWTNVYSTSSGGGGTEDITGLTGSGRYLRLYATQRATGYGDSLYSFDAFGS